MRLIQVTDADAGIVYINPFWITYISFEDGKVKIHLKGQFTSGTSVRITETISELIAKLEL